MSSADGRQEETRILGGPNDYKTILQSKIDLSRRWGISARTLEQWRWRGEGSPFVKIGCRVRYRIEDVEQYEQQHILTCTGQTIPSNTDETTKPQGETNV